MLLAIDSGSSKNRLATTNYDELHTIVTIVFCKGRRDGVRRMMSNVKATLSSLVNLTQTATGKKRC